MSDQPPGMDEMLWGVRAIWGSRRMALRPIVTCLTVTVGDLAWQARAVDEGRPVDREQVAKELGNLMLSARRWMADLDLDAEYCLELGMSAQIAYVQKLREEGR